MATKKKLFGAAAGAAGGAGGLNVEDVFSTYLYTGNGSTQTITNGIDLAGEGGLVWLKSRSQIYEHQLHDSTSSYLWWSLNSNNTNPRESEANSVNQFKSDGFVIGGGDMSVNGDDYVTWTFRKAPKFFDVVQYNGDNTTSRQISHNLGAAPGVIIVKCTNTSGNWVVYHKDLSRDGATVDSNNLVLNENYSESGQGAFGDDQYQTSTYFTLGRLGSGFNDAFNKSGNTYVAYLFAHNDGDGEFGPNGDQDIIKCGSYAGNGSTDGPEINLGFEPQFIMVKKHIGGTGNWFVFDTMRGLIVGGADIPLRWNDTPAETNVYGDIFSITPTGFKLVTTSGTFNDGADEYIYIAIRRGPMAVPESATDVFDIYQNESTSTVPAFKHPFPVDFGIYKAASNTEDWWWSARPVQGQNYRLNVQTYSGGSTAYAFDYMDGWFTSNTTQTDYYSWAWKRAPQFFDIVNYRGTNSVQNVPHNLGVAPKLMMIQMLKNNAPLTVYFEPAGNTNTYYTYTNSQNDGSTTWNSTSPTDSVFTVKGPIGDVNYSGYDYMALLFGEIAGISKIGSYTGNGTSQNIDCGFSSGARFVLIKPATGHWYVFDTERGIISGNDPYLRWNYSNAQTTVTDYIDPYSSGFTVNSTVINGSGVVHYFYAIA